MNIQNSVKEFMIWFIKKNNNPTLLVGFFVYIKKFIIFAG